MLVKVVRFFVLACLLLVASHPYLGECHFGEFGQAISLKMLSSFDFLL
jgi:hypothetical protein